MEKKTSIRNGIRFIFAMGGFLYGCLVYITFLIAYINPNKAVIVLVDLMGEAEIEAIILPAILLAYFFILIDWKING